MPGVKRLRNTDQYCNHHMNITYKENQKKAKEKKLEMILTLCQRVFHIFLAVPSLSFGNLSYR
jgi:hypothetical protein